MKRHYGKGCAVKHGMLIARGELCLMLDADGATPIADLEHLEAKLRELKAGQVIQPGRCNGTGSNSRQANGGGYLGMVFGSRAHL